MINLLFAAVFGAICAAVAHSKGRNAIGWFFIGFFFSCIGIIIILCLSDLNEEKAKWDANEIEQRRLREQLRQEQIKNASLRKQTNERLDLHDEALGIDTKNVISTAALSDSAPAQLLGEAAPPVPTGFPADEWFYEQEGKEIGPCSWDDLCHQSRSGNITPETLVWVAGMPDWKAAKEVPNLISS